VPAIQGIASAAVNQSHHSRNTTFAAVFGLYRGRGSLVVKAMGKKQKLLQLQLLLQLLLLLLLLATVIVSPISILSKYTKVN